MNGEEPGGAPFFHIWAIGAREELALGAPEAAMEVSGSEKRVDFQALSPQGL